MKQHLACVSRTLHPYLSSVHNILHPLIVVTVKFNRSIRAQGLRTLTHDYRVKLFRLLGGGWQIWSV